MLFSICPLGDLPSLTTPGPQNLLVLGRCKVVSSFNWTKLFLTAILNEIRSDKEVRVINKKIIMNEKFKL